MRRLYRQRTLINLESPCEMICNIKTLLIALGALFCHYGLIQAYALQTTCLNYTGIPLIWTLFEVVSFFIWILVSFTALWQYSERSDQWFEDQICRILGPQYHSKRSASRSPSCSKQGSSNNSALSSHQSLSA